MAVTILALAVSVCTTTNASKLISKEKKDMKIVLGNQQDMVRDHLWVWAHDACFDWDAHEDGASPAKNRMTPVEGAVYMGISNVMFIQLSSVPAAPFEQYFTPFKAMKQVYWTLSNNGNQAHKLGKEQEDVYRLAAENPNITGLLLDDFLIGPNAPNVDSDWLAANNAAFPIHLTLDFPQAVTADSLALTQTAWSGGGYLTGKFAVDLSIDGTNWQEIASGEMPAEPGAIKKIEFPAQQLKSFRIRVLSSLDTEVAMSCGFKDIALFFKDLPVPLAGASIHATSEFPGHEASQLLASKVVEGAPKKMFTSQVSPRDLAEAKRRMQAINGRKLDLAVVVYSNQLDEEIVPILNDVDTILFWTWNSSDLEKLETNFQHLKRLLPARRIFLGCYMWDFCLPTHTIPIKIMKHQYDLGLKWLKTGEIEGIILLGTNIMDKNLKAVEWTRKWIKQVGNTPLDVNHIQSTTGSMGFPVGRD